MILLALLGCTPESKVILADEANYELRTTIASTSDVIRAREDAVVDWSGLTRDLLGYELDPTRDVTTVAVVQFGELTQNEVLQAINDDSLLQDQIVGSMMYEVAAGETSANLSEFSLSGYPLVPAEMIVEGGGTYMVTAVTGADEYRMFGFFAPIDAAGVAPITLAEDSSTLAYEVAIDSGIPVRVPSGGRVDIDWSQLTTNGAGLPIDLPDIDTLTVARYDESVAELEADFLRLQALPEESWSADVNGWGDWYLQDLRDSRGDDFPGLSGEGTWLLALICSTCLNPSPSFLALVEPE